MFTLELADSSSRTGAVQFSSCVNKPLVTVSVGQALHGGRPKLTKET